VPTGQLVDTFIEVYVYVGHAFAAMSTIDDSTTCGKGY